MDNEFGKEAKKPCCSGNCSSWIGVFECNICFEVAQDPVLTLCGHLYCWPCLYSWLHNHSRSKDCAVCKAVVQEGQLVPIYGRGKSNNSDHHVPNRPTAHRPETAPNPPPHFVGSSQQDDVRAVGGFLPIALAWIRNFSILAAIHGLWQSVILYISVFHDAFVYGTTSSGSYLFSGLSHRGYARRFQPEQRGASFLKICLFIFGCAMIVTTLHNYQFLCRLTWVGLSGKQLEYA